MKDKFQMSSLGELTFFLGLQVKQKKDGIFISQDKYVAEILRKFELSEGKSASTPIDAEKPLLKDSYDLDTFSSVRRPRHRDVIVKKKRSSNTSNVGLSAVSVSNMNKNVKRYSRKDLLAPGLKVCAGEGGRGLVGVVGSGGMAGEVGRRGVIVQICLWIIDSGCSKHMTGNRALLTNFVKKFLETIRFGNNDFAVIAGYGDVFIDGVDLLTGDRLLNMYTIALNEVASNSSTCLLAKASSSQSWLWHQRIVQICLWIIDSGCSKHMMGNRALLTNFVEKFLGTVRFGSNDFTVIAGYGDVIIGSMTIKKVYFVEEHWTIL
uniref:Ribonuclease H-like domain-containing protein n=1 Tax=Tanacetum cinerariifolium TaxID=118510 RepID=A0A6L2LPM7_TANCI|nr:ribonuclease H-like domain-containing protein [Tanacetum cinerariifolium]